MFKAVSFVLKEHYDNIGKIITIGTAHAKSQTLRTSLGLGWVFFRDIIYFGAFIIFRYMLSGSGQIENMHYIVYLITGIVPWNFINEVINSGSNAINMNSTIVKSIRFPISIIPTIEVLAIFIKRMFTWIIPFVMILLFGDIRLFSPLLFIYYFISMFIFLVLFNFIVSAFVAISEDFMQLYQAFTRILFFLVPILWSFDKIGDSLVIEQILKINPMIYIINGFRDAFVHGTTPNLSYTIYFWSICIVLLFLGSFVQFKMRRYYSDFM